MAYVLAALFVCGVPLLYGLLALVANLGAGQLGLERRLLGGRLLAGQLRAFCNSVWTLWATVAALLLHLGRSPGDGAAPGPGRPVLVLVHGLYHTPSAWFVMRRRLERAGLGPVRCFGYSSFGPDFASIARELADTLLALLEASADARVRLVGHSLGGLLIRAALADARLAPACAQGRIAGVVSLGSPHKGSLLAQWLGIGALAHSLGPRGEALRLLRALPAPRVPWLSLFTPTDGMVLPLGNLLLGEAERQAGWQELALPAMSHVGLLYSGRAAAAAAEFLRRGG